MLTPPRDAFPSTDVILIDIVRPNQTERRLFGEGLPAVATFTAFWIHGSEVWSQCYRTDLADWIGAHEQNGRDVVPVLPCSYPGCGRPTAYLMHADGQGYGWRHVFPSDEALDHVGYPMPRTEVTT
jgi:hypothetical protein